MADADAPYQSLYRRYRPQNFAEVRGQDHVTRALRNAVRDGRVAHAYLFSGPRGTGKTSTARILAKALNCTDLRDGEPCDECRSCVEIRNGSSLDVQELDAASNNGVDAMRDLVARAALGNPGRRKVYIVDEVHMLSPAASNALLKTLEEPPGHVVFVLATTDPQKVLPTIRSRTQHYEFRLLGGDVLAGLLNDVNQSAGLGVSPEAIDLVMRRGSGSARDALSVLDQVAAAGDVADPGIDRVEELVDAVADRDAGRALLAIAEACSAGIDARRMANDALEHLRNAFLLSMKASELVAVPDVARDRLAEQAARLGPAGLTRAMEAIGQAVVDMREALDPRITLEVAVVRLARPEADVTPAALLERIERLERGLSGHVSEPARADARAVAQHVADAPAGSRPAPGTPAAPPATPPGPPLRPPPATPAGADRPGPAEPATPDLGHPPDAAAQPPDTPALADPAAAATEAPPAQQPAQPDADAAATAAAPPPTGPAAARTALGALRQRPAAPPPSAPPVPPPPPRPTAPSAQATQPTAPQPTPAGPQAAPSADLPSRDALTKAWGDAVLPSLSGRARARFSPGRFVEPAGDKAVFALPNAHYIDRCEELRSEVEGALAAHFGRPVPLKLVVDAVDTVVPEPPPGLTPADDEEDIRADDLRDAPEAAVTSPEDRLREAFPGIQEVDRQ